MPIVNNTIRDPAGIPASYAVVTISLVSSGTLPGFSDAATVDGVARIVADKTGSWSADLTANADIIPGNTHYLVTETVGSFLRYQYRLIVPNGGPFTVREVLATDPVSPDPLVPVGDGGGIAGVSSLNGRTGAVTITKADVALDQVNNTSDAAKPVSTAQATAIAVRLLASANLSDVANVDTARRSLGLRPRSPVSLTEQATIATDASLSDRFRVTLTADRILGVPQNPSDGWGAVWEVTQDGAGGHALTLATTTGGFAFSDDLPSITVATGANKRSLIGAIYCAPLTRWLVVAFIAGF